MRVLSLSTPAYHDLTVIAAVGMLPSHNAPIAGPTFELYTPPTLPPVIQFVAGPPRILPHYRAWSASRIRRSRSRSQPVNRALSPSSAPVKPSLPPSYLSPRIVEYSARPVSGPTFMHKSKPCGPSPKSDSRTQASLGPAGHIPLRMSSSSVPVTPFPDTTGTAPTPAGADEWPDDFLPISFSDLTGPVLTGEDDDLFAMDDMPLEGSPSGTGSYTAPASGPSKATTRLSWTRTETEEVGERHPSVDLAPLKLSPPAFYKLPRSREEEMLALLGPLSSKASVEAEEKEKPVGRKTAVASKRTSRNRKESASNSKNKGKGKEKEEEEMTQKRIRSPEEAADGDEGDERPTKVCIGFLSLEFPMLYAHYGFYSGRGGRCHRGHRTWTCLGRLQMR